MPRACPLDGKNHEISRCARLALLRGLAMKSLHGEAAKKGGCENGKGDGGDEAGECGRTGGDADAQGLFGWQPRAALPKYWSLTTRLACVWIDPNSAS